MTRSLLTRCLILIFLAAFLVPDGDARGRRSAGKRSKSRVPDQERTPQRILSASTDFVTESGMRVFLVPDHEVPLVSFQMRLAGGSADDPAGKEGLSALLTELLTKGAGSRDARQFRGDVEFVGGRLAAATELRWLAVGGSFLKNDVGLGLELLSDMVLRPRLDLVEFAKERGRAIDGLAAARQQPRQLINRYWSHWVFGSHAYARPWSGDERSLASLSHGDIKAAARRQLAPQRAWLAVAGDFEPAAMRRLIEARFGKWSSAAAAATATAPWKGSAGGRVLLVDKPDALQTYFVLGNRGFDRSDPDHVAREVANTLLGGRFTSRLNKTLRTDKGFTYGARSRFDDARGGLFTISTSGTSNATTAECLPLAESLYRNFLDEGISAEELKGTQAYLAGQFGLRFETGAQQAAAILDLEFDGLSRDLVDGFLGRVKAVQLDEVNRVIRERFPRSLDWVVIGRAETCSEVVAKLGKVTRCALSDGGFGPPRPD